MDRNGIITKTASFVKQKLEGEGTGHDWWHIERVRNNAVKIAREEDADIFIVELAALLHDIADWKFHGGDEEAGPKAAREWLNQLNVDEPVIAHICDIIKTVSFKGAGVATNMKTKEGACVQDADRLDAMGAIGIARAFAYGGHKGRELHNPHIPPERHGSFEQYKKSASPTLNHFYEKLFLLKELMNTPAGKRMAEERHRFMEAYVARFLEEWNMHDTPQK